MKNSQKTGYAVSTGGETLRFKCNGDISDKNLMLTILSTSSADYQSCCTSLNEVMKSKVDVLFEISVSSEGITSLWYGWEKQHLAQAQTSVFPVILPAP